MRTALFALLAVGLALAACGGDKKDADPFDTLQACYDEHHTTESLSVHDAIVVCCLDHPIGPSGEHPSCKNTQADCVAHVHTELPSVSDTDVQAACTTYITMK
ncbi:MAG: hypothetical protein E6J90_38720 [Deltaproteobacteria bacterium]|nr:MAG: hypothetical protein E6J90_38720 [Deltaproteobacteria bacterium]TMQ10850.1 MAG: hypothetical protein E6J91_25000 [Deltaproteobacteria bacterium]